MPATVPAVLRAELSLVYADKSGARRAVTLTISGDARYRATVSPARLEVAAGKPVRSSPRLRCRGLERRPRLYRDRCRRRPRARADDDLDCGALALARSLCGGGACASPALASTSTAPRASRMWRPRAQIARVLRGDPKWRLRAAEYDDGDGGGARDRGLTCAASAAVVNDLVARSCVARARLTAAGYGVTNPWRADATEPAKRSPAASSCAASRGEKMKLWAIRFSQYFGNRGHLRCRHEAHGASIPLECALGAAVLGVLSVASLWKAPKAGTILNACSSSMRGVLR